MLGSIVDYFIQHPDQLFYSLTGICLVLELSVLGMSGPLLFVAMGSLVTGVMISLGPVNGWEMAILVLGLATGLAAALLWKPLKRFQNAAITRNTSSDMIDRVLQVAQPISLDQGAVSYSGIEWPARLAAKMEPVPIGQRVRVVAVDGSLLLVQPE